MICITPDVLKGTIKWIETRERFRSNLRDYETLDRLAVLKFLCQEELKRQSVQSSS